MDEREDVMDVVDQYSDEALRVLAMAYLPLQALPYELEQDGAGSTS